MKRILLSLMLLALASTGYAQKFKLSGTIDGVTKDTLIVWYKIYNPDRVEIEKKVPVRNGKFKFSTKLKGMAASASLTLQSRPNVECFFTMVPGEEAIFSGRISPDLDK